MAGPRRRGRPRAAPPARVERDRFGAIALPADSLYGIQTARSLENLSFSGKTLGDYPDYVRALAMVKQAAVRANRDARVLDARRANQIERACERLRRGGVARDQFPADLLGGGGSIAVNMNINEVIASLANANPGARGGRGAAIDPKRDVNASQSTADVCHSASRIAILERWDELRPALRRCAAALGAKAREFRRVITLARTCLQDAAPVSLGAIFGAHRVALERRAAELERSARALLRINLGATAIGDGRGAPPAYRRTVVRHLRAIARRPRLALRANLYDAAQNSDDLGAMAAALGMLAEVMIKIAQDLRLLSSGPAGGFGEIALPAVQEGSSFYAGKINPVVPETIIQCCFQVLGCERAARLALERGELDLNVFEGAAAVNLFDALAMLRRATALFTDRCIAGIAANRERCAELAARVNRDPRGA
jgi:aspartate ammonia-lyase